MAHADFLPEDVVDGLAAQIGAEAGRSLGAAVIQHRAIELAESFSVWTIGADAVARTSVDVAQLARQTGKWHHQIKIDGKAESFARSMPLGPDAASWSLRELFASEIARRIDEAIGWIDQNVQGDPLVRLLIVPAYHVHAFWLLEGETSRVVAADMPRSFIQLQYGKLYTSQEFLEALTQEQHVVGVNVQ